jgi:hypothetical protein
MICKGTTHNNGVRLAKYMTTGKPGERAELWQLRGFEAVNIRDAFRDVHIMANAGKCQQPFFHVQVRNRDGEQLTREQWEHTADRIERMLGLGGQPRAIAFHTFENGDSHMHLAWSRIRENDLTAIPLPFFKQRLKKLSRELELEFGLDPVTNHRPDKINFAPTRAEQEQARRLGLDIHEIRNTIRSCYERSDCGASFQAALLHEGMTLAQGERRDYVVIDQAGGIHALGKRMLDVTAARIRDRFSDLSREELPTIEMARVFVSELQFKGQQQEMPGLGWDRDRADRLWQDAVIKAAIEKEQAERNFAEPAGKHRRARGGREQRSGFGQTAEEISHDGRTKNLKGAAREVWEAWCQLDSEKSTATAASDRTVSIGVPGKKDFAEALDEKGIMFAVVSKDEAERSHREASFAKAIGRYALRFKEGEVVIVTEPRPEFRRGGEIIEPRRVQKLDQTLAEKFVSHLDNRTQLRGIDATVELSNLRSQERRATLTEKRMEAATRPRGFSHTAPIDARVSAKAGRATRKTVGRALDAVSNALESLFAPTLTPEQKAEGNRTEQRRAAEAVEAINFSHYTAEMSQRSQQAENELEAERRRQREGGGRER